MKLAGQPTRLDEILGLHIRLAHGAVLRHFAEHFAGLDLSQKQVSVLWLVHDHPGIAQTDLARRMQMDRATTMAIVHALERKQLLARAASRSDGRRVALSLTATGEEMLDAARVAIAQHEQWLTSRFSAAELRQLTALLRRIHDAPEQ
ncbi:MarR family winged helix-turn-helix transcriptional regulator [Sphingomonas sp.]|uniref:MarR family winged helix-turn-helix transcriptional regulator n=1 Tax=Sphingomonas sp. TaxID=28214 RepID=UPI003B3B8C78